MEIPLKYPSSMFEGPLDKVFENYLTYRLSVKMVRSNIKFIFAVNTRLNA